MEVLQQVMVLYQTAYLNRLHQQPLSLMKIKVHTIAVSKNVMFIIALMY